jgi:hypothetical protein
MPKHFFRPSVKMTPQLARSNLSSKVDASMFVKMAGMTLTPKIVILMAEHADTERERERERETAIAI